ncbi:hypothetical protein BpHYR1_037681 [Brachionus plicatilis]|uniref:Uncharacterized protein n=1 Tax=Brachionus plicatilis TaxID=10195 RepID=A0A3M7QVW7_BRAPC|nr:hypothetical protein BpHYR1_037681 [Brachionus plicatilis]
MEYNDFQNNLVKNQEIFSIILGDLLTKLSHHNSAVSRSQAQDEKRGGWWQPHYVVFYESEEELYYGYIDLREYIKYHSMFDTLNSLVFAYGVGIQYTNTKHLHQIHLFKKKLVYLVLVYWIPTPYAYPKHSKKEVFDEIDYCD